MPYANVEDRRANARLYKERRREHVRRLSRESYWRVKDDLLARRAEKYRSKRLEVIAAYGAVCAGCGNDDTDKLQLHHKQHDGEIERSQKGRVVIRYSLPVRDDLVLVCTSCHANERKRPRGTNPTWNPEAMQ